MMLGSELTRDSNRPLASWAIMSAITWVGRLKSLIQIGWNKIKMFLPGLNRLLRHVLFRQHCYIG